MAEQKKIRQGPLKTAKKTNWLLWGALLLYHLVPNSRTFEFPLWAPGLILVCFFAMLKLPRWVLCFLQSIFSIVVEKVLQKSSDYENEKQRWCCWCGAGLTASASQEFRPFFVTLHKSVIIEKNGHQLFSNALCESTHWLNLNEWTAGEFCRARRQQQEWRVKPPLGKNNAGVEWGVGEAQTSAARAAKLSTWKTTVCCCFNPALKCRHFFRAIKA